MTTIHVYRTDTNEVIAEYHGLTFGDCLDQAEDAGYMGNDEFGLILLASDQPNNLNC